MILHCIRHGESTSNAEGRVQGQLDVPLSNLGLRQSEAAAAALAGEPIDALFASPLRRAYQTAEMVAERLKLDIRTDARLKEIHAGVFQGKLRSELQEAYPEELARWTSEDLDFVLPGGESRRQLIARGREALETIVETGHRQVAVVAHGRLLIVTLKSLLGIAPDTPPFALNNGSITTIRHNGDGQFELIAIDRTDHLSDVGVSGRGDL